MLGPQRAVTSTTSSPHYKEPSDQEIIEWRWTLQHVVEKGQWKKNPAWEKSRNRIIFGASEIAACVVGMHRYMSRKRLYEIKRQLWLTGVTPQVTISSFMEAGNRQEHKGREVLYNMLNLMKGHVPKWGIAFRLA